MLRFKNYTPDNYYSESRDFQLLCSLFDIVLNAAKTNADQVGNITDLDVLNADLLELRAMTLGLNLRSGAYEAEQIRALCKVFPLMLRKKGTAQAIEILCSTLFHVAGIQENFKVIQTDFELILQLPFEFKSVSLIMEIMSYILPAGLSFYIQHEVPKEVATTTAPQIKETWQVSANAEATNENQSIPKLGSNNQLTSYARQNILALVSSSGLEPIEGFNANALIIQQTKSQEED